MRGLITRIFKRLLRRLSHRAGGTIRRGVITSTGTDGKLSVRFTDQERDR